MDGEKTIDPSTVGSFTPGELDVLGVGFGRDVQLIVVTCLEGVDGPRLVGELVVHPRTDDERRRHDGQDDRRRDGGDDRRNVVHARVAPGRRAMAVAVPAAGAAAASASGMTATAGAAAASGRRTPSARIAASVRAFRSGGGSSARPDRMTADDRRSRPSSSVQASQPAR